MIGRIETEANAKVNLDLRIIGRRPDGYHELESVFQKINLHDKIIMEVDSSESFRCEIIGAFGCPAEENLMHKAAHFIFTHTGTPFKVTIACEKQIPEGGGLGGGSSDAAVVLAGLNQIFEYPLTRMQLFEIGSKLGSDIPFFLSGSQTAMITGRGEVITPLSSCPFSGHVIVVSPGFQISTASAYGAWDQLHPDAVFYPTSADPPNSNLIFRYSRTLAQYPSAWDFKNDFFEIVHSEHSEYALIENIFQQFGVLFGSMTGSGSAYYGLFHEDTPLSDMSVLVKNLISAHFKVHTAHFLL